MFDITPYDRRNRDLSSYDPFTFFRDFEERFFGETGGGRFNTDIIDNDSEFVLAADLPGFNKEDIKVDIDGDILTIKAEHSSDSSEDDTNTKYVRRERTHSLFVRRFNVSNIKADEIKGSYENGVLKLRLPKKSAVKSTARRLELE